jgi:hypothetical protein
MARPQLLSGPRRWPAIALSVLLVILATLWIDSYFHERHFIFLPGGDVGLGFATDRGNLHWVEYAPWSKDPRTVYWSKAKVPFLYLMPFMLLPFFRLYALRKKSNQG